MFCQLLPWCCSRRSHGLGAAIPCRGCCSRRSRGLGAAIPCRGCCSRRSHGSCATIPCHELPSLPVVAVNHPAKPVHITVNRRRPPLPRLQRGGGCRETRENAILRFWRAKWGKCGETMGIWGWGLGISLSLNHQFWHWRRTEQAENVGLLDL